MELDQKDILTVEEVAELLSLHPQVVRRKTKAGQIPGRKINPEQNKSGWRYSRRQIIEWVEEGSARAYRKAKHEGAQ